MTKESEVKIIENLSDAGCCTEMINDVIFLLETEQTEQGIRRLRQYRSTLMNEIHEQQRKVDCLDYMLYQLKGAH